ncbi:pyridoxamine 5'-phosphate oxidase family protein [Streptomyces sp. NPDC091387]|uniref:pyridoxamine 5'-phosphate oxidase family protein n=1 Tax=Streptomyces sp. NPDC091387 TaxID=3365998 RepID=UPI0037FAE8B6
MSTEEELHAIDLLGRVPYGRLATSMRALPFLTVARHVVIGGRVVLRMHSGLGYHDACDGTVVAYGADNFNAATSAGSRDLWSVQFTGPAEVVEPARAERELFGPAPVEVNGEPFTPAFLRLDPHFVNVHTLDFHATRQEARHSVI